MNRLSERLTGGLDAQQQAELGDLRRVEALLAGLSTPEPDRADTARLLATLDLFMTANRGTHRLFGFAHWLRLARTQAVLIEKPFWLACILVFIIGLALALLDGEGALPLLFVFLSPAAASAGVAYAFRPATRALWELERITPTHTLELLYTRLALVIGFNSLLALLLLSIAWWQSPSLVIWRLLLAWLGPMLALAGIALYGTVRWGSVAGILAAMGSWGVTVYIGWWRMLQEATRPEPALWLLELINRSNLLVLFFLALSIGGLWLLHATGRWMQGGDAAWS
ncbi:MAG TPA: hypothetical protein VLH85_04125 [Levilinea sp.]|nr:hypothetical protein [Levilinea sp.]